MSKNALSCESSEIHVKYRIANFLDLPMSDNYHLQSPDFSLYDAKWYLLIYPNKLTNGTHHIGLYLGKRNSIKGKDHHIIFKIVIKKNDGSDLKAFKSEYTFTVEKYTLGWPAFLERSALTTKDVLAPDGSLTIFCTIYTGDNMEAIPQTTEKDGTHTLSENLKDLYIRKSFSDATIVVKGKEFPVHRSVLAARSKVFDSMFKLDMVEKQTGQVKIEDCDPDPFEKFLLFLYTEKLDYVPWSQAINIYKLADKYDLPNLKTECVQRLTNRVCMDSFCDVIHFAAMYSETKLLTEAKKFFTNNTKAIISNAKWKIFLVQHPLLGNELFANFVDKYAK